MAIKTFSLPLVLSASCGISFFLGATTPVNAAPAVSFEFCIIEECTPAYQREAKDRGLEITPPSSSDCSTQKDCMALAQKLYQLPANKKSCSVKQFNEFETKLEALDAKYTEIGQQYNIDMAARNAFGSAVGTKITVGLGRMLTERFTKCEEENLFPENTNECLSLSCKKILADIQNRPVSKEECNSDFRSVSNLDGFKFEKTILENAEKNYVEACQDANFIKFKYRKPANLITFPEEIYKKELPYMEAGVKLESEVKDTLDKFKVNAESCAMDYWLPIYSKLKEMRDQYAQVPSIRDAGQNAFDSLTRQLDKKLVECKENGVFPQNIECVTQVCKSVVAKIKAVPISEKGCDRATVRFSYGEHHFTFEESLVEKANEEHEQACIDANITPLKTIGLGGKLYKKDLPYFEAGEKAEEELENALHGLDGKRTTQERCSRELFENSGKNLQAMKENFSKLSAVENYKKMNYENLEFARDRQAVRCSNDGLFPFTVEYGTCFTGHCKDTLEDIQNFKVGERSCDFEIHGLSPNPMIMLKSEREYIQDRQNELFNQCVDAGFLDKNMRRKVKRQAPEPQQPSEVSAQPAVVGETASVQNNLPSLPSVKRIALKEDPNLTPAQRALLKRFYLMDVTEKKGGPNGAYQIVPYTQIGEKLKALKATPEDCNAEKVFIPIYSSVVYFEDMFEAEHLPLPKELIDLRNQVWQYRDMCVKAGF